MNNVNVHVHVCVYMYSTHVRVSTYVPQRAPIDVPQAKSNLKSQQYHVLTDSIFRLQKIQNKMEKGDVVMRRGG